jgi:LPXTG-motif cell wall-anchored protein
MEGIMEQEEYIVDGEEQRSNRPFLTAVGVLLLIFVLAAGCGAFSLFSQNGNGGDEVAQATVAAIETQNAIVAVTNAAVTQTIIAMETEAARPTDTPTPPPPTSTPTPLPSDTPPPTETPVVAEGESVDGAGEGDAVGTPNLSGTSTFDETTSGSTPTPIPVIGSKDDSLPDTGIEVWSAVLIGLLLVGVLLVTRRLRSA